VRTRATLAAVAATVVTSATLTAQDAARSIKMRNWEFKWEVVKIGFVSFTIVKTHDALYTSLSNVFEKGIRLTPQQAASVALLLRDTDKQLQVLRKASEKTDTTAEEEVQVAEDTEVCYVYEPKQGGHVSVMEKTSPSLFSGNTLRLSVTKAEAIAEKMADAVELCKMVDAKIMPND